MQSWNRLAGKSIRSAQSSNKPDSKAMKELGIAHFAQRGTPRSSVRLQAEEAQKERNKNQIHSANA